MPPNRNFIRLHRRKDILRVIREGWRIRRDSFELAWLQGEEQTLRIAVVVPLMGKRAVDRNRLRRRIRDAIDRAAVPIDLKGDAVLRARRGAYDLEFQEIQIEVKQILSRPERPNG
ncbi:MAG: ribonuclease P protein component [Candidatus Glassbacteria bacterium RBG_16_58_8]|uniref:Ribonuclease P protein component n=1 Tax=Candidatus Glassbacteria bacterium RBG_16_58_8 TaxID=1817866 RepID=A0A1F5YD30_9BACT|nr:MAG: ribonuclease P protein component [Candidatus Glassbacteria bacterium RBG_16_58_8]